MSGTPVLAVLCVHPPTLAATRLRAAQYGPALAAAGVDMVLWTFLRQADLADWYGPSHLRRAWVLLRALTRIGGAVRAIRAADVVLVQREALPLGPPVLEWFAARSCPVIWDVDDAVWVSYVSPTVGRLGVWLRGGSTRYERVCRWAAEVWAGNETIAAWCRARNPQVRIIPTVVPVPDRPAPPTEDRVVGWIGSHSTAPFLESILPAVVAVRPPPRLQVVGASIPVPDTLEASVRPWSEATQEEALSSIRVGLYPIDRSHPNAEGKSGLKAVLYMSRGIPPVVTPTGANAAIVRDGVEGLHAESPQEWTGAVQRLLDDPQLWRRCSEAAYRRADQHYSLQVWAPRVVEYVRALLARQAGEESPSDVQPQDPGWS